MKRFIRYLYEYDGEKRIRNAGFIKVETGCEETIVHMQAKGFHNGDERNLKLYLFYEENGDIVVLRQGEMQLTSPVLSWNFSFAVNDVDGEETYSKICGVLIEAESGRKMAATWDDRCVNVNRRKKYVAGREEVDCGRAAHEEVSLSPAPNDCGREEVDCGQAAQEEVDYAQPLEEVQQSRRILTKISRRDISKLPRCEWKLANNQFLMHGYNNYHHLLLIEEGNYLKLGVPGIYHIKEANCAENFGFEEFLSTEELGMIPEDIYAEELFGYWCRPVRRSRHSK